MKILYYTTSQKFSSVDCSMWGLPVHHQPPEFTQTRVHWVSDAIHLILCCPFLLPSIFPSIRVLSNKLPLCIRWPKYWSFSFSMSPSNKYSGLISSRMDWLDLFPVQWTLKSLLHHHSSKASILQHPESHTLGKYYCEGLRCCSWPQQSSQIREFTF